MSSRLFTSYNSFRISLNQMTNVKVPTASRIELDKRTVKYKDAYGRIYYWNRSLDLPSSYYENTGIPSSCITFISKGLSGANKVYNSIHAEEGEKIVLTKIKKRGESVYTDAPLELKVSVVHVVSVGSTVKQVAPVVLNMLGDSIQEWDSFLVSHA